MTVVLAIESATDAAGVAVADDDGLLAAVTVGRGRRHAETIAPAVVAVCRSAGVALADLAAVSVDIGPGLFTGLRVGIATATGLAYALGVSVVPVLSLDVLAATAAEATPGERRPVAAVVDARRGEVFWAWYDLAVGADVAQRSVGVPARTTEPRVGAPAELAEEVGRVAGPGGTLLLGDGARRYAEALAAAGATVAGPALAHPPVGVLAAVGVARAAAGEGVDPGAVSACYLREADARINWERR